MLYDSPSATSPDERYAADTPAAMEPAYLAAIMESSDDAIIGKDLRGIVTSWNRGAEAIFGYTADEVIGRSINILFPPDRLAEEAGIVEKLKRGERIDHHETFRRRKDGTDFPVSLTVSPIRDSHGTIVGASKVLRDISERLETKRDLEKVVMERTAALTQRNLLLREVYHRVKNNLQIVDAMVMLQARKIEDPIAKQALLGLRSRIFALGLVHQQLMGSTDLQTFDVGPFLRELSSNILEGGSDDSVTLSVDAHPLKVGLDFAVPLGLLVAELVTNAFKHAFPMGKGKIGVVLRPDADGKVILIVSDDGQVQTCDDTGMVDSLVAQLGGTIIVSNHGGTTTDLRIPMPVQS
jgi:PAS domain S-box-containing protein